VARFAVVIPLYNKRPHIERAMRSVFKQTLAPHEIIVVDDGSTDGSYEYVQGLDESRIRLHRRSRPGPGGYAARNFGVEHATEEWIAFLDADDEWLPHHLETIAKTIESSPRPDAVVCVGTGYRNVYPGGREDRDIYSRRCPDGVSEFLEFRQLLSTWLRIGGAPVWTSAAACRKDALISAGLFPADRCTRGGDKDMWLRIGALGVTAINPTVSATYYKDSVNMVTGKVSANDRHCICESIEAMLPKTSALIARLLRKIYNLEVYKYSVRTIKTSKLAPETWKGFFAPENPVQYLILATLSSGLTDIALRPVLHFHPRMRRHKRQAAASRSSWSLPNAGVVTAAGPSGLAFELPPGGPAMTDMPSADTESTGIPVQPDAEASRSLDELAKPHDAGCARTWAVLTRLLKADLFRYAGKSDFKSFIRHFMFTPGYKYTVWMRTCGYLRVQRWAKWTLYPPVKYILLRCRYKYGIVIPEYTVVGPGLFINRFGGIYINGDAVIGSNVNLTHGTMLGQQNRGALMGSPIVGDRVFIAAGAKVIGRVRIGNGAVVGANAVVTKDVPDNAVVGGIPAKVISLQGSEGYINRQARL
jgi:serine O-acetyltransferase